MKFKNSSFSHTSASAKIGVLISNLGTPDAPSPSALRKYLKQFLSDPRVVEFPRLLWMIILHGIILRVRPRRSAKAYQSVWREEGSPLAIYTKGQAKALTEVLTERFPQADIELEWAMRYGEPSVSSAIDKLMASGVQRLLVLPLYPQYSASTTASTFDALAEDFTRRRWLPELHFVTTYHQERSYVDAIANSIRQHWQTHGRQDKLVFSYHGVPLRYLHNGDPYHCFCLQTTRLVAEKLQLEKSEYMSSFQSRFGREPWLQPYTDESLINLAQNGVQSVAVICPGFSADCLETIEEIDEENRHYFLEHGGKSFFYIPALNDDDAHIQALADVCESKLSPWLDQSDTKTSNEESDLQTRFNQAQHNHKTD